MELRSLFVRIKGDTSDLEQKLGRTNSLVDRFKQGVAMGAGFGLFHQATNAIGGVSSAAIKLSADYEQSMNLLQASSGASAAEMEALRETAKSLGSDISLPGTSAADATVAMLELNKAGLSLNDTIAAARGVLQLSAAAQIDNATAAQITANALNTFGLAGSDATRVADLLAAGANSSSASITDLSQGVQQAGFAFKATNQNIDDLVTAVAALTNVGLSGSDGATALKNAMLQLAAPTDAAQATMRDLGINVRDAQGNMLAFPELIDHLKSRLEGLSPAQRDAALKTMLQSDGMKAMIPLLELGSEGFEDLKSKILEQGAAAKMAEAQNKGFHGAMDGLKSAAESLAINGLTPILPLLTGLIQSVATVVGWIGDNFPTAIAAAAFGLGAYAIAATTAAVGTGNLGLAMVLAASQAATAATAFAAAAFPLAAIAGMAVILGATVFAIDKFGDKLDELKEKGLQSRDSWVEAKTALEEFNTAGAAIQQNEAIKKEAEELERLTKLYEEKYARATGTGGYGNAFKAFFDDDGVTQRQVEELKSLENQLEAQRQKLKDTTTAQKDNTAALDQAIQEYWNLEAAASGVSAAFVVTQEEIEESAKIIERLASQGPQAMNDMVGGAARFLVDREAAQQVHEDRIKEIMATGNQVQLDQENEAYRNQELAAAQSYANQQAAQRTHLGQMLIDWINAQAMVDEEFAAKSGELVNAIAAQYGVVADAGDVVFGQQLNAIRSYVDGAIPSLGSLMSTLDQNEQEAIATRRAMETLTGQYVAELTTKWETGGYGTGPEAADQYRRDLEAVPGRVYTEIVAEEQAATAAAGRAQAVYDRMDRKIETVLEADPSGAETAAASATQSINDVPDEHTTTLKVDGSPAVAGAAQTGHDINAGLSSGIHASAYMVANAMQKTAESAYMAAKGYLQIQSPSRRFHEIGQFIDEGLALGVAEHANKPTQAVENLGEKLVSSHERYLDDLDTATQRFAEEQAEIWDQYYADLAEQTDQFNRNKFDDQLDFYDQIAELDSAAREAAIQRQREAWDVSQQMAQEGRAAEAEEYYNAALEEIEADTQRAEKLAAIDEDLAEKRRQLAEEQDAARKAALEAEIQELESREQYLKEVDEQRDARAAERLEELRNAESEIAEERDESLSEAQKEYNDTVKAIEDRFMESFSAVREGIGGVAESTESAASTIISAYNRISAAAQAAASSAASSASSSSTSSDEIPQGSYALGTGDRGLPRDGLFHGHAEEIIANPDQSDALRDVGGIEQAIAKARSYDDLGGQLQPQRGAVGFTGAASSQTFILEKLADTLVIKDELDIEVVAAQVAQKIKRRMS